MPSQHLSGCIINHGEVFERYKVLSKPRDGRAVVAQVDSV